ncbi:MAG: hypothetical protein EBZ61_10035 [Micrococcales bacterium]|nr:hypothetical protein [Micrococcales bacterium]
MTAKRKLLLLTGEKATHKEILRDGLELYAEVLTFSGPVSPEFVRDHDVWAIVSDRNGHILSEDVLVAVEGRAYNSHPSVLPLHRGWQPIFFSVWYGTEVGISIHQIDRGLDTGNLVFQSTIDVRPGDRLETLHYRCRLEILRGWCDVIAQLAVGQVHFWKQTGAGSYHPRSKFDRLFSRLPSGWRTEVAVVREIAARSLES